MPWDKDHPPEEFWGSNLQFGAWVRHLGRPAIYLWLAMLATPLTVFFVLTILSVTRFWSSPHALLGAAISLGAVYLFVVLSMVFVLYALRNSYGLYYLCFPDSFRVRVDRTGPIALSVLRFKLPTEQVSRFTSDNVTTLSVSEDTMSLPRPWKRCPAITLLFRLQDGTEFRHTQRLCGVLESGTVKQLRRFQDLLDRLEAILGPDRIDSAERFARARETTRRVLVESESATKATGTLVC